MGIEHGLLLSIGAIIVRYITLVLLALSLSWTVNAQAASAPAEPVSLTSYVSLFPALVGNYGAGSKLKYYKADIALRVKTENVDRVQYHEPLIRDQLIQLFAQQSDADMNEHDGKEAVRQAALLQVQKVLSQEEGETLVEDLLFNNLVVQP